VSHVPWRRGLPFSRSPIFAASRCFSKEQEGFHAHVAGQYVPLPKTLPDGAIIRYPHLGRAHVAPPTNQLKAKGLTIAIIGASAAIGRQLAIALVSRRKEFAGLGGLTLQFVGDRQGASLATMMGLCSELRDAFEEFCPHLEVVVDLPGVQADIIVMAAGAYLSTRFETHVKLAQANSPIFGNYASGLLARNSKALILIASNPVEFAVDTFVNAGFSPSHVIGVGAFLDSQRFRREIASELGVPRQHISGLVLGAHGLAMVPCWSTVRIAAVGSIDKEEKLEELKTAGIARMTSDFSDLRKLAYQVKDLAVAGDALAAAAVVNEQPAEVRAALRRYISFFSGPSYPRVGIGSAVARLIVDISDGKPTFTSAQIRDPEGTFLGIKNQAIGTPAIISGRGVKVDRIQLLPVEEEAVLAAAEEAKALSTSAEAISLFKMIKQRAKEKSFTS